jgi:homoserine O-acetyltransferase
MAKSSSMADEYAGMDNAGTSMPVQDFVLESGRVLEQAECMYKSWGTLNEQGTNVVVICHALTGNASADSWWGALLGRGRVFDTSKYFVFCSNVLGSCYGSSGPSSKDPKTGRRIGSDFPQVTIRDMVRLQAAVLDMLGVTEIACAVGGSMGGMQALEFALEVTRPMTKSVVSLCSSGRHQPWQIGISECQRQAIYADPLWKSGMFSEDSAPTQGLAVARMIAMVTYRSHPAYWTKFGRSLVSVRQNFSVFDVEEYLRAQGRKFYERSFDAGAYVRLTQAMDSHDVARGRGDYYDVLRSIKIPVLVVSISSDVLYPVAEQLELARYIPNGQHHLIESDEGHDGFLLEHRKMGTLIRGFLAEIEYERNLGIMSKL